jgi:hypothetical protein
MKAGPPPEQRGEIALPVVENCGQGLRFLTGRRQLSPFGFERASICCLAQLSSG